jgi:perosamine synthetase
MPEIDRLAKQYGFSVVEDACQTPGARIGGRIAGTWGDVGVLSFGGSKILTAGRGGAVFTADEQIQQRITVFANRGNDAFALSELQAAVLPPQLENLNERNLTRRARVEQLQDTLSQVDKLIGPDSVSNDNEPVFYKVAWLYKPAISQPERRESLIAAFVAEGIAIDAGFRGFAGRSSRRCRKVGSLEYAATAAQATILLHHPILLADAEVIDRLGEAIVRVVRCVS